MQLPCSVPLLFETMGAVYAGIYACGVHYIHFVNDMYPNFQECQKPTNLATDCRN